MKWFLFLFLAEISKMQAVQREREEKLARKLRDFVQRYVRGDKEGFVKQAESEAEKLSHAG